MTKEIDAEILKSDADRDCGAKKDAIASDEDVMGISKRFLAQNKEAYEVLAK